MKSFLREFLLFGVKEARACIFAGSFFVLLFVSSHIPLFGFARYDFLFLAAILIQVILVATKLETKDEVKVIALFHLVGLCLEIFKTNPAIGSWSYPEAGFFKVLGVPLYSGFMYAAVGSYFSQAWKILKVRLDHYPPYRVSVPLAIAIYLNFFTHHFVPDMRWILTLLVAIVYWKTTAFFTITTKERRLPLVLSFAFVAFFIWIAENISTYLGAWQYPSQIHGWDVVSFHKIHSWFLLVIISFIIVADLKHYKAERKALTRQTS